MIIGHSDISCDLSYDYIFLLFRVFTLFPQFVLYPSELRVSRCYDPCLVPIAHFVVVARV
jgi:hypothetical protein